MAHKHLIWPRSDFATPCESVTRGVFVTLRYFVILRRTDALRPRSSGLRIGFDFVDLPAAPNLTCAAHAKHRLLFPVW